MLANCWPLSRREFFEIKKSSKSSVAHDGLKRIAALCAVEAEILGLNTEARLLLSANLAPSRRSVSSATG